MGHFWLQAIARGPRKYACKCCPRRFRGGPHRPIGSYRCSVSSLGSAQISSDQSYGATDERGQLGTRPDLNGPSSASTKAWPCYLRSEKAYGKEVTCGG
jgi:hypothetical protein